MLHYIVTCMFCAHYSILYKESCNHRNRTLKHSNVNLPKSKYAHYLHLKVLAIAMKLTMNLQSSSVDLIKELF